MDLVELGYTVLGVTAILAPSTLGSAYLDRRAGVAAYRHPWTLLVPAIGMSAIPLAGIFSVSWTKDLLAQLVLVLALLVTCGYGYQRIAHIRSANAIAGASARIVELFIAANVIWFGLVVPIARGGSVSGNPSPGIWNEATVLMMAATGALIGQLLATSQLFRRADRTL